MLAATALLCLMSSAADHPVALPPGVTPLGELGRYRVAYQSYGGKTVVMPPSWTGHFEEKSGISYLPAEHLLGRDAILLHSPWRVPPGKVWVEYSVLLPRVTPIQLRFGIAMRRDMLGPKRSDGATFSCYIDAGKGWTELMRFHQAEQGWKDYHFDLDAYAGQAIRIRLQTEPGPQNDPGFDYSYFGNACIEAGKPAKALVVRLDQLMARSAVKAGAAADLRKAANRPTHGILPSPLFAGENRIEADGKAWLLSYRGPDGTVIYRYTPERGMPDEIGVRVDGAASFRPTAGAGVRTVEDWHFRLQAVRRAGDRIETTLVGTRGEKTVRLRWRLGIRGKALTFEIECPEPIVRVVSLGNVADASLRRVLNVPYYNGTLDYLPENHLFVCRQFDWTLSHASICGQKDASYAPKTDGTRNPVFESGFVIVSPHVAEVFPNLPHPPSPFLEVLGPRIMLDIWAHHQDGTFQGDAITLRRLKDNGVDHLAIIQHVWQRYGYDVKLPNHIPANPAMGGDAGMAEFGRVANACGYLWSVHENYIDLYPDAPSYDPSARVLRADGSPSPAWFNRGTGVQSFGLKCNRALEFARQNSPEIHRRYQTTAAYLDVHTCVPPWHQLDHEADQPYAAMGLGKVHFDTILFQYMRDTHGGPLFGEGNHQFYWAGRCDGVEAQVDGGEDHRPFLDFDLLKLHPQMVNHGMGYYERWYRNGYSLVPGADACAPFQIDKYRAMEIAYGHAGFIGNLATANAQWVAKEHNLMFPIQRLYGTARVIRIEYEVDGRFVPTGVALALDRRRRQHIVYDSGLQLWVNWDAAAWTVEGQVLPQWGFLALGPDTEVRTSLLPAGIADVARCPDYVFVDARTAFTMPYLKQGIDIEPRLHSLTYLGNRKIRLVYEWRVGEPPPKNAGIFVHFYNDKDSDRNDGIVTQNDHDPPKPMAQWHPGDVLLDGPHVVELPDHVDRYEILVGLYSRKGRARLKGIDREGRRYLIGAFTLKGDTLVQEDPATLAARYKKEVHRVDFHRNMNAAGTWVDVGEVATDGSVKITRGNKRLVVYPYPRDRRFAVEVDPRRFGLPDDNVRVQALKACSDEVLTAVDVRRAGKRIRFEVGHQGAGRYLILPVQ